MRKYLTALVCLFALATYVAVQKQEHPGWMPPNWYHLFKWPEGVTAWAVLLTLVVIAEQTSETRRSAESAARQADIAQKVLTLQFRPMLKIRTVSLDETDDSLSVKVVVVNGGGTNAYIREGTVSLDWVWNNSPKSSVATAQFESATLRPGEQEPLHINLNENWLLFKLSQMSQYASGMRLRCEGTIVYGDENQVERQTRFSRLRNAITEKWEIDPDPEYEYQD